MTIREGFLLRALGDTHVVVPLGQASIDLRGMISLNETGAFLWELLQTEQTPESLTEQLMSAYEVDAQRADADVKRFVQLLRENDLLSE